MFLKEVVDNTLWQSMQDEFTSLVGFPISTIDLMGNILFQSGKYPFFCDIVLKKGERYCQGSRTEIFKKLLNLNQGEIKTIKSTCHAGLTLLASPIFIDNTLAGAFLCSSIKSNNFEFGDIVKTSKFIKVDSDELLDEVSKLANPSKSNISAMSTALNTMSKLIPKVCFEKNNSEIKLNHYNFLLNFSKSLHNLLNLNKLTNSAIKQISKKFEPSDCVISLYDCETRLNSENNFLKLKKQIEKNNFTQIKNTKSAIFVRDSREDFILKGIENIREFPRSIFALPLLHLNNLVGMLTLYFPINQFEINKDLIIDCANICAVAITNAKKLQTSHNSSITDNLTELFNKGYFFASLNNEIARAKNFKRATSLILLDIDNFKQYNDTYGHPAGDALLRDLGKILKEQIGTIDTACRYGGEEFAIIIPETKPEHAFMLAEKVRMTIANYPFKNRKTTISVGLATCLNSSVSADTLIKEADKALYKSKNGGRNKTSSVIIVDKNLSPIDVQEANQIKKMI